MPGMLPETTPSRLSEKVHPSFLIFVDGCFDNQQTRAFFGRQVISSSLLLYFDDSKRLIVQNLSSPDFRAGESHHQPHHLSGESFTQNVCFIGDVGYMVGTLMGVLLKATIPAIITINGAMNSWWAKIFTGLLLLLFIVIQRLVVTATARRKSK